MHQQDTMETRHCGSLHATYNKGRQGYEAPQGKQGEEGERGEPETRVRNRSACPRFRSRWHRFWCGRCKAAWDMKNGPKCLQCKKPITAAFYKHPAGPVHAEGSCHDGASRMCAQ